MKRLQIILVILFTLLLASCGKSEKPQTSDTNTGNIQTTQTPDNKEENSIFELQVQK